MSYIRMAAKHIIHGPDPVVKMFFGLRKNILEKEIIAMAKKSLHFPSSCDKLFWYDNNCAWRLEVTGFMAWYQILLGVVTIVTSLGLTVLVILQESKSQGLGVISGGAENLFGKSKGRSFEDKLVKYTKWGMGFFFVLTLGTTLLLLFWNS